MKSLVTGSSSFLGLHPQWPQVSHGRAVSVLAVPEDCGPGAACSEQQEEGTA